ncbi:antifungal protein ginkbilobin-like protein 1 [Prosopis cineraria]|uniref:antifungal protein ginkbilobin-like protein 1 n=1 Tax=Prosopis cineraria TaxID=364024 RepID=UPI00240F103E|nr:antifungal protein ginkbilobin-like protein 1 [Prosopis cineraria]
MLQRRRPNLLLPFFALIFCALWILNGVVSDPQTYLLKSECNSYFISNVFVGYNVSVFDENLNATFRDIRKQINDQNKHFATARQDHGGNPVATLFQCRNYLSVADCVVCFDMAAEQIRKCASGTSGAHVIYDGCFLRFDISSSFFDETTQAFNSTSCGNQTSEEPATVFTLTVEQVLMNLQKATPRITAFSQPQRRKCLIMVQPFMHLLNVFKLSHRVSARIA